MAWPTGLRHSPEKFWANTAEEDDCLVWTACRIKSGYGRVRWEGRTESAHRVAFFLRMGRWPEGLLRHLCNNPPCVLHVVEGTKSENSRDAVAAGAHAMANKTHCKNGHPFDEANTYVDGRQRHCRVCNNEASRRLRERRKKVGEVRWIPLLRSVPSQAGDAA